MEYTVLIQPKRGGGFKATVPALPQCRSTGATEEEAMARLRVALDKLLQEAKITSIEVDENGQQQNDPWLAMAGKWANDPTFDEFQQIVEKYRKRPDTKAQTRKGGKE
jgi:predicted RNase H-like HicB family nuclease